MKHISFCLLALLATLLCGCSEDATDMFSHDPAYCRICPVTAVQPLREALTSPGSFCTITFEPTQYVCTRPDGTFASLTRTDEEAYGRPIYRAGFIVGTPSLPDAKTGQFYYLCYELACPSCYKQQLLTKPMELQADETAHCTTCGRTYSMRYGGGLVDGPDGEKLMKRYNCSYAMGQDLFIVQN